MGSNTESRKEIKRLLQSWKKMAKWGAIDKNIKLHQKLFRILGAPITFSSNVWKSFLDNGRRCHFILRNFYCRNFNWKSRTLFYVNLDTP